MKTTKILIASLVKSIHFIPQIFTLIPFRAPIPATSHLHKFGFKGVKDEK